MVAFTSLSCRRLRESTLYPSCSCVSRAEEVWTARARWLLRAAPRVTVTFLSYSRSGPFQLNSSIAVRIGYTDTAFLTTAIWAWKQTYALLMTWVAKSDNAEPCQNFDFVVSFISHSFIQHLHCAFRWEGRLRMEWISYVDKINLFNIGIFEFDYWKLKIDGRSVIYSPWC